MRYIIIVFVILVALLIGAAVWMIGKGRSDRERELNDLVQTILNAVHAEPSSWDLTTVDGIDGPVWINEGAEIMVVQPAKPGSRTRPSRLRLMYRGVEVDTSRTERSEIYQAFLEWTSQDLAQRAIERYNRERRG